MKLMLNRVSGQVECIDWLTALVGLKTIPDARSIQRVDAPVPVGSVVYLWKSTSANPYIAWRAGGYSSVLADTIIQRIEAGEDV